MEEEERSSRTGTISSMRRRAERRSSCSLVRGVDEEAVARACLAAIREKREEVRDAVVAVSLEGGMGEEGFFFVSDGGLSTLLLALVGGGWERRWALIAPALRSWSLRWPFARRGARVVADVQGLTGRRGRVWMKSSAQSEEAMCPCHCFKRF